MNKELRFKTIMHVIKIQLICIALSPFFLAAQQPAMDMEIKSQKKLNIPTIYEFFGRQIDFTNGTFDYYFKDDKIFIVLPPNSFKKDFLLVRDLVGQNFLKWERKKHEIFLIASDVYSSANSLIKPYSQEYHIGEYEEPILAVFPIAALSEQNEVLIDITDLFIKNIQGLPGGSSLKVDGSKSYIKNVRGFPNSIEIEVLQTEITGSDQPPITFRSHWSIYKLPDEIMEPRIFDPRMGFFMDKARGSNYQFKNKATIRRWRLKKKVQEGKVSEPEDRIVFYLDPRIPKKYKQFVKEGVLAWLPAFKAAGFENSIEVRDYPVGSGIKLGDMNYSFIRWKDDSLKRKFKNPRRPVEGGGTANTVIDWRSGEILKGDVIIWSPVNFLQDRYFLRAAAHDIRARSFPFPDSLTGALIRSLVSHETGHALGLKDGNYGEYAYPFEKLNSKEWLKTMGHTPSIMNYTRSNNLIQNSDTLPKDLILQKVGPADIHSIIWGYQDFGDLSYHKQEKKLDGIVQQANKFPWLRYVQGSDKNGPYGDHEVSDNDQPIASSILALNNLKMIMKLLPDVALNELEDNFRLEHLYFSILDQWILEMEHINSMVGGYSMQNKFGDQDGPVYNPIAVGQQKEAVAYLLKEAFETPRWMVRSDITHRFQSSGMMTNISSVQNQILSDLLSQERINRMIEQEILNNNTSIFSYVMSKLHHQIWKELESEKVSLDLFKQELQKNYLIHLGNLLDGKEDFSSRLNRVNSTNGLPAYAISVIYGNLMLLKKEIDNAIPRSKKNSAWHLERMEKNISKLLNY